MVNSLKGVLIFHFDYEIQVVFLLNFFVSFGNFLQKRKVNLSHGQSIFLVLGFLLKNYNRKFNQNTLKANTKIKKTF